MGMESEQRQSWGPRGTLQLLSLSHGKFLVCEGGAVLLQTFIYNFLVDCL